MRSTIALCALPLSIVLSLAACGGDDNVGVGDDGGGTTEDGGPDTAPPGQVDGASDAPTSDANEAGGDAGADVVANDAPSEAESDAPSDAPEDASDASDAGTDAEVDSGFDAGDAGGGVLWARGFAQVDCNFVQLAEDDAGDRIIAGMTAVDGGPVDFGDAGVVSGGFVAGIDSNGSPIFAHGSGAPEAHGVAHDPATGVLYATFGFHGTVTVAGTQYTSNGGSIDLIVAKLDAQGNVLAAKQLGGPGDELGGRMAVGGGRVAISGVYNGGAADLGTGALPLVGDVDSFVASLDATSLSTVYAQGFGASGSHIVWSEGVALDTAGNLFASGYFNGQADFGGGLVNAQNDDAWIVALDPTGAHLWSRVVDGAGEDTGLAIAVDAAGQPYLAGQFAGTVDFGGGPVVAPAAAGAFVLAFDAQGAYRWALPFASTALTAPSGLALDAAGDVALVGSFRGQLTIGGKSYAAGANEQFGFLAKLDPTGSPLWSQAWAGTSVGPNDVSIDDSGNIGVVGYYQNGSMTVDSTTTLAGANGTTGCFVLATAP